MTFNTDIQKTEKEIAVLQAKLDLLKEIEAHKSQPKMHLENEVDCSIVSFKGDIFYRLQFPDGICCWYMKTEDDYNHYKVSLEFVDDMKSKHQLESVWKNEVLIQKNTEPYCPDEPDWYDEVEWDEKDNPNLQKVIDKMVEERKSKKLRNMLKVQLNYDVMVCDDIVDIVEEWILDEQSASGSQNVNTELLVEGFNDCVRQMKEMLR